jgi:hypothetical protein
VRTRSDGVDHPDDLVTRDRARSVRLQIALDEVQVRPADPTAGDAHEDLPRTGHGGRPIGPRERSAVDRARRLDDPRSHRDLVQAAHGARRDLGAALEVA